MKFLIPLLFCTNVYGFGGFVSPMPSTFTEVSTSNTHVIERTPHSVVLRGSTPDGVKDLKSLLSFGVKKFMIFKNDTHGEVDEEVQALIDLGVDKKDITYIPMPWKNFYSFKKQCDMTIAGLREIENAVRSEESLYFHCTSGEDRTGYLTALWKVWKNPNLQSDELFLKEMCAHGYDAADRQKPPENITNIRAFLTPLYFKMFDLIRSASLRGQSLNDIICEDDEFRPDFNLSYRCF